MTASGSYDFEALVDSQYQLERLRQQASAVRDLERRILCEAGLKTDHTVLEIGSGPGFVTNLLSELAPEGCVHAVEPNGSLSKLIDGNVCRSPAKGLFVHQAFGDALPIEDGVVDFVYLRFVLQHIPSPASVLREAYRVLRPGGRLCVVDSDDGLVLIYPDDIGVASLMEQAQRLQAAMGGDRFIGRSLQSKLFSVGFSSVRSRVLSLTSSELPFDVLFNILLGYKATLLGEKVDIKSVHNGLAVGVDAGTQLIAAGVFVVTGEKA